MGNQQAYETEDVVRSYASTKNLEKPEQTILELFQSQWAAIRFLDLGVGGGRTTEHFAPLVKHYLGADYSEPMIVACRRRFASAKPEVQFEVCDARRIGIAEDGSFDFVLFSYNGIDSVSHEDRLQILREVRRVLRPGGHFFFSSHNIRYAPNMFRFPVTRNPLRMWRRFKKYCLLRHHNPGYRQRMNSSHCVFKDGAHKFTIENYYVDPEEQVAQLNQLGFGKIRKFSTKDGLEIEDNNRLPENQAPWLFYLCQAGDRLT